MEERIEEFILDKDGLTRFRPGSLAESSKAESHTKPKPNKEEDGQDPWVAWGTDNLFPATVVKDVYLNSVALRALRYRISRHYGYGIRTFQWVYDAEGRRKKHYKEFSDWKAFCVGNEIPALLQNVISDYEWFMNSWVEAIVDVKGKIVSIKALEAVQCRMERKNDSGVIPNVLLSAHWPDPSASQKKSIPLYNPKKPVKKRTAIRISSPSPGNPYYPLAYWDAIRQSGWLEIANEVPKWKKAAFLNAISLKYHIKVNYRYWKLRYKDWDEKPDQQQARIQAWGDEMNKFLTGTANTMKSFVSHFEQSINGTAQDMIIIEPLKVELEDGAFLPDSFAANTEILWGIGVHPALLGMVPGKALNTGSGSNIQKASEDYESTIFIDRDATLSVLRFIRDFNKMDEKMEFEYIGRNFFENMSELTPANRSLDSEIINKE